MKIGVVDRSLPNFFTLTFNENKKSLGAAEVAMTNRGQSRRDVEEIEKEIRMILIPKPGKNRKNPSNWRPTTIGSTVQRLLDRVLANRLSTGVCLANHQRCFAKTDGTFTNS